MSIREDIDRVLRRMDVEKRIIQERAVILWPSVVGERIASATHARFARSGIIHVTARDTIWAQELALLKEEILERLNDAVGERVLEDIRFRVGELPERDTPTELTAEQELARTPITEEDVAAAKRAAACIPDKELRTTVEAAIARQRSLARWRERSRRLEQGEGESHCST